MLSFLALAPLAFAPSERTAAGDLVTKLPGWDKPLPSRMYSGYINVTADREMHVHYLYVESEQSPDTDPVLLWTNGGPGASSMFGLFVELGPLLANEESLKTEAYNATGVPTLFNNPHSWSRLGSVLMFDWPPPVGFSYCSDPAGNGTSCGDWDDTRMAAVSYRWPCPPRQLTTHSQPNSNPHPHLYPNPNSRPHSHPHSHPHPSPHPTPNQVSYAALSGWYERFAERRANPLYLTGTSHFGCNPMHPGCNPSIRGCNPMYQRL